MTERRQQRHDHRHARSANFHFASWTGRAPGTDSDLHEFSNVQAAVKRRPRTSPPRLTRSRAASGGNGSVTASDANATPTTCTTSGAACTITGNAGSTVTFTATPVAGFSFASWSGLDAPDS